MKSTFNLRARWRVTTALCVVSTMAVATASYAADWGRRSWGTRKHPNRFNVVQDLLKKIENDANGKKDPADGVKTASPIKHVIILIGENRGLDHTFGAYKPKGKGQTISNLLSKGIVNEDGTPAPNFAQAQQFSVAAQPSFYVGAPPIAKSPYSATNAMPQPNTEGTPAAQSDTSPPFKTIAEASVEKDMDPADLDILTTGFTGLPANSLDTRVPGAGTLVGPFALQGRNLSDDDYSDDSTHRLYQD